jgi:tetratricopeptide (TPR) repeat protein
MRRRSASRGRSTPFWVCVGLAALSLAVYFQLGSHPFINFDDPHYVTENPHVNTGLTRAGVIHAWTAPHAGNWHPLTWLSHMLDVEWFGLDAGRHHAVSVLLHTVNAVLLFLALRLLTGAVWRSAVVAALFAVHPTHVESVAWIAERKDVLSACGWLLALLAYGRYAAAPSLARYVWVALAMAFGLLAKPMVVTLPFVLLLLDHWPLRRTASTPALRLVLEKLPLFAMSLASSVITYAVQRDAGAVRAFDALPLSRRLATAALGYWEYVWKTIWPVDLALLYPHRAEVAWGLAALAIAGLAIVTVLALAYANRRPYLAVGWLWFLGTLVPVIGLIQVGSQRIADRYTYIPTIGLFIVAAWGCAELAVRFRVGRLAAAAAVAVVGASAVTAHAQAARWQSSISIWAHTVAVTRDNARAHNHLGHALAAAGRDADARRAYETALALEPDYPEALNNLGALLARHDEHAPAIGAFQRAIALAPRLPHARANLGLALVRAGQPQAAVEHLEAGVREDPSNPELHRRLGVALAMTGRHDAAIASLTEALRLAPADAVTHNALGAAYGAIGRLAEAIGHYREAARLDPRLFEARGNLGRTLLDSGQADEGKRELHALAVELIRDGQIEPALQTLEAVLRHDPAYQPSRQVLEDLAARSRAARLSR